ncbi:MAG: gluconokinase, partial [Caulobacteraceae bacterium]
SASARDWVLSCSALKRGYREQLSHGRKVVRFVFLEGSQALIARRIESRRHAYMPASLLASQFADLEPPGPDEDALRVDVSQSIDSMVDGILAGLGLGQ